MSQKRYSMGSYAISINGEQAFIVLAHSQLWAIILAAVDSRYRQFLRERQGESLIMTAKRISDM